jgi:Concanavalin A-like lectin/glucanases superfamily
MGRRALTIALTAALVLGSPVAAHALTPAGPGVVGLWQGEGDATDSFHAHDGTLLGGAGFAPASVGQAFSFTAAQEAVDIPDDPSLYPAASFTVAGWVRTSDSVGSQALMGHYECGLSCPTDQANSVFALYVEKGKALGFIRDADAGGPPAEGNGQELFGSANIADGADHYLAFERDSAAEELRLYVDGALDSSAHLNAGATGPLESLDGEADDLYLGSYRRCSGGGACDGSLVSQLNGLLDDAIYWDRAVPGGEIAAIHAAGPGGLTTDSTAPTSIATAPAAGSPGAIHVSFTASDPPGPSPDVRDPSGVARVDLYVEGPGESSFTKTASVPGSSEGSFTYTASTVGTYSFATVGTDVAGNVEVLPASPDAVTRVAGAAPKPTVTNFVTAIFVPPTLYLRLKCPARFKPGCLGNAIAVTDRDRCTEQHGRRSCKHGTPMTNAVSANQKSNSWKVIQLTVKPQYTSQVAKMTEQPDKKLLNVRQLVHAKQFEHGRPQPVFHIYRVQAATSP